jgi:hypothetical protein
MNTLRYRDPYSREWNEEPVDADHEVSDIMLSEPGPYWHIDIRLSPPSDFTNVIISRMRPATGGQPEDSVAMLMKMASSLSERVSGQRLDGMTLGFHTQGIGKAYFPEDIRKIVLKPKSMEVTTGRGRFIFNFDTIYLKHSDDKILRLREWIDKMNHDKAIVVSIV